MNAAAPHAPPQTDSPLSSLLLAVVVHLALLAFLWVGVRWQSQTPAAVEAEVWDMTVQEAAPPAPEPAAEPQPEPPRVRTEPEPAPREDPEIALEQARRQKAAEQAEKDKQRKLAEERKRAADEKLAEKKKQDELKAKQLAQQKALEKMRQDDLRRVAGLTGAGTPASTGAAPRSAGPRGDPSYAAEVVRRIKSNITYGGETDQPGNPTAEYRITQLPSGEVVSVRRVRSSGIPAYDAAVEKAIAKSSPLPKKKDGTVEREILAIFTLKENP